MPDPTLARAVAALFDLGEPREEMTPVAGGLSHEMWRLVTSRGAFAVKVLNRDWGKGDDGNPDWVAWYERAFRIEMAAYEAGVSMPRPIAVAGSGAALGEIDCGGARPLTVNVRAWADGVAVPNTGHSEDIARLAGALVASVHALRLPDDGEPPHARAWGRFGPEHWRDLHERIAAAGIEWADEMRRALPAIAEMEAYIDAAHEAAHKAGAARILCHRDADQKNVLMTSDGRLVLCDWDGAGPVEARRDTANHALVWAGAYFHEPEVRLARAFLDGYRGAGGEYGDPEPYDFVELMMSEIAWFSFNARRVLGERLQSEEARKIAMVEAASVLRQLPRFASSIDAWTAMLRWRDKEKRR